MGSELRILPKISFWENWLLLLYTNCILSCYNISRNPQKANHETKDWIILAKLGASYFPKKELFMKVDQHCLGLTISLSILSCHFISKKLPQSRSRK